MIKASANDVYTVGININMILVRSLIMWLKFKSIIQKICFKAKSCS